MSSYKKPTDYFDEELAAMLAEKIIKVYPEFEPEAFVTSIRKGTKNKALKQRVELIADELHQYLPDDYLASVKILLQIFRP